MRSGIAAAHGGFALQAALTAGLRADGHAVVDFGAQTLVPGDDYPDVVVPLARAVADGAVARGGALCGSGVGACSAANKVPGVRAALIADACSARQGVEDDDMHVLCLGGRVTGGALAGVLVHAFLAARFARRLAKVAALEGRGAEL